MIRLLPLWWHPGMSHDSWTRNYRVRTLSFDHRAITCECANEGMFKNVFASMTCVCVCVCVYDQWDRWSASVDPECPKSRGRKWERYNYSRIVGCSRSKFLKNIPDRRTLLCLKYMHADFDPLNMVDLMWRELLNLSCIYLPSYDKTNWRRPWTERVNTLRMYYENTLYHICVS